MHYFENFDLESNVTPVNADILEQLLIQSEYDIDETKFLVNGFRHGFPLGYEGCKTVRMTAPNLPYRGVGDDTILWNKVMKEIKAGRFAGPFKDPPFEYFIQSPIGLVPKDNGQDTRLIFHLSYPRNKSKTSVNACTPAEICKVKYPDFSRAIELCLQEGKGCAISRSDLKSAFRNLSMMKKDFCWLLMKARNPLDGLFYYIVDKCLPFGSSISCSHFQRFSNCVAHLVSKRTGRKVINYLDDYLFAALLKAICDGQVHIFLDICSQIGFPVNLDKTFWGTTQLVFLGLLIDTIRQVVMIPIEKIETGKRLLEIVLNNKSKKLTLLQLQKICGFLNFLCGTWSSLYQKIICFH